MANKCSRLLAGLWLMGFLGCGKCSESPQPSSEVEEERDASAASLDVESLSARLIVLYGEIDKANRYSFTVMVKPYNASGWRENGECSGVLVSSRLVLTAGHCVCMPREAGAPEGKWELSTDAHACLQHAVVTAFVHEPSEEVRGEAGLRTRVYKGEVRPHPTANLAVVLLEKPLTGAIPVVPLADTEAQDGEAIIMVGYGYDEVIGGRYGARRFSKVKVTRALEPGTGGLLFEEPGMRIYPADSGGPCLREEAEGVTLVGVLGGVRGETSTFMSTHLYRDWLRAEIMNAAQ